MLLDPIVDSTTTSTMIGEEMMTEEEKMIEEEVMIE